MSLQPGVYEGKIRRNDVKTLGGKEFVELLVDVDENFEAYCVPTKIWLTDKAMNMARASLKKVGFDVATEHLSDLAEDNEYLAGRPVTITVDCHPKYGLGGSVNLDKVSQKKLTDLERRLRASADDGENVFIPDPPPVESEPAPPDVVAAMQAEARELAADGNPDIPF